MVGEKKVLREGNRENNIECKGWMRQDKKLFQQIEIWEYKIFIIHLLPLHSYI